jgi:glutathione S-transferase
VRPRARLYSLELSHPANAARLMLEWKGIEHEVTCLLSGFQPLLLRALGFRRGTTPALKIDGRRIQGSRQVAAALDDIQPEPPLFPADAELRSAVFAAEAWGEREFQPVPRRLLRWGFRNDQGMLRWEFESELGRLGLRRLPAAGPLSRTTLPIASYFARVSGATDEAVRANLEALPGLLDRVARLIDSGVIGGAEPNAADFQIGATARLLHAFEDLRPVLDGTAAAEFATRILPDFRPRVPAFLPPSWIVR